MPDPVRVPSATDAAALGRDPRTGEPPTPAEDELLDHMVRRPTEEDFADVLTPEGNSGDLVGRDVADSVLLPSNSSIGGTF